ncbi:DEAD/DEAH box helicase [Agrococcus sp. SL85]|uniref:DEAD/DEAH box helicase n=1 Tax=Agrococcus sp. SL85 TaxID=2995141 RepID=UPI00226CE790|nr:DEAD/DEAH box helicase [Agrococcus sp. SL85]WAC66483.1 DEAD/DEAH box helicase [Agrococcus sp. SL85]
MTQESTATHASAEPHYGSWAADHLSPAYPERAAWGTAQPLRAWQQEALELYFRREPRDFLAAATPGAGKTTFALRLASELLRRGAIARITVVAPTEHLKQQWADAAHRAGIRLDPDFANAHGDYPRQFHGVAVTYAQVAARPSVHARITTSAPSLVILDEVHHAGDALSWGDAVLEAFGPAARRLSLTGTPFRSDTAPIPFVEYVRNEKGVRISSTDYAYGYDAALRDGVVRPVLFMAYAGTMQWRTSMGDEMKATLGQEDTKDITSAAWRTALDPGGEWMQQVLRSADVRLTHVRQSVPDAGGLVIATDQAQARQYAQLLRGISGEEPTVVLSDDTGASDRIDAFSKGDSRWMVAVRMVSEGVDVPRLSVGVYATSSSTPLFFAQVIGRFVRSRRRGEVATVFLPSVPPLMGLAAELERQRDHALDRETPDDQLLDDDLMDAAAKGDTDDREPAPFTWEPLESSATFDRVLFGDAEFGQLVEPATEEEMDFIGIPGLLDPEEVSDLLKRRHARQAARIRDRPPNHEAPEPLYRSMREERQLLNSLVAIVAKRRGEAHALVHAETRRVCGGPAVAQASMQQLRDRIHYLRRVVDRR